MALVIAIVQISFGSARQQTAWGISEIDGDINRWFSAEHLPVHK
jgi:hypothetical protein